MTTFWPLSVCRIFWTADVSDEAPVERAVVDIARARGRETEERRSDMVRKGERRGGGRRQWTKMSAGSKVSEQSSERSGRASEQTAGGK